LLQLGAVVQQFAKLVLVLEGEPVTAVSGFARFETFDFVQSFSTVDVLAIDKIKSIEKVITCRNYLVKTFCDKTMNYVRKLLS
jgi:hypothetical protein